MMICFDVSSFIGSLFRFSATSTKLLSIQAWYNDIKGSIMQMKDSAFSRVAAFTCIMHL